MSYFCFINLQRMIKYNKSNLNKIVGLLTESAYKVRFEKGNFISGHAVVLNRKIVIVNKFLQIDMKINALLEIMYNIEIETGMLSPVSLRLYKELIKSGLIKHNLKSIKSEEE